MHRFAQYTVIWKIFQNVVIQISCNRNDEIVELSLIQTYWIISTIRRNCGVIIDTDLLNYFNYSAQLFCKLFLTQLTRISIWIITSFIEYYRHIISKTSLSNYLPFIYIFAFTVCVELVTPASLWRHKGVAMHVTRKTMHRFSTMHD